MSTDIKKSKTTRRHSQKKIEEAKTNNNAIELQQKDLKVSGFCRPGAGTKRGVPGGCIYEKASSRHKRHREVYKSSSQGQAISKQAVPLGSRRGKSSVDSYSEKNMKRKLIMEAAKKKKAPIQQKK